MGHDRSSVMHGTTILAVRRKGEVIFAGDGQVSLGNTVIKGGAKKLRKLADGNVLLGLAGSTADAFTLVERLETELSRHPKQLTRACVELAKGWRMDKYLRKLEAMLIVADKNVSLLVSGTGDVLEPEDGILAIGSGGSYALSAAKALYDIESIENEELVRRAMKIAGDICVFTNHNLSIERLSCI